MNIIRPFDPWRGKLCTCPTKYSFCPYTGCSHRCVYCYASAYIPNFYKIRVKKQLETRLVRDVRKLPANALISIANSSDPYPPEEMTLELTRKALSILANAPVRVLIITKGTTIVRDIDILKRMRVAVAFSISTIDERLAKKLEPGAPTPEERFKAIKQLADEGIPTILRIDPIFWKLTDGEIDEMLTIAKSANVVHIVASTFKPRPDGWNRMKNVLPGWAKTVEHYYLKGETYQRTYYLPTAIRYELMRRVYDKAISLGFTFATCREGFTELHTGGSCDGSHLIPAVHPTSLFAEMG